MVSHTSITDFLNMPMVQFFEIVECIAELLKSRK